MEIKNMTKEELEALSYTDLARLILKENNESMNTPTLFKKICELLEYSESEYESNIGDFYTSLTTDKRFILLEDATWDLRDKHSVDISFDEDEEDEEEIDSQEEELEEDEEQEEDIEEALDDEDIPDDDDDDMDDLAIIDEEEELEEN